MPAPTSRTTRPTTQAEGTSPERLQRILARAGLGSRRAAEDLIRQGRVRVDGRLAELGDRADPRTASVTVDGAPVPTDPTLVYFALNKPAGVTTTLRDRHAERSLAGYLPRGQRVFPVGRLDRASEGLLLLTNDGRLAHRVQHPRYAIEKEYLAEVAGNATRQTAHRLVKGVSLDDGVARAVRAVSVQGARGRSAVRVVMTEGRKREVRRMLQALGLPVTRLIRTRIGPVTLGDLAPGRRRPLATEEVLALYASGATPGRRAGAQK